MGIFYAVQIIIGSGMLLFAGAAMVGLGLHLGLRLGANWFGAIKVTSVQTVHYSRVSTTEGE